MDNVITLQKIKEHINYSWPNITMWETRRHKKQAEVQHYIYNLETLLNLGVKILEKEWKKDLSNFGVMVVYGFSHIGMIHTETIKKFWNIYNQINVIII